MADYDCEHIELTDPGDGEAECDCGVRFTLADVILRHNHFARIVKLLEEKIERLEGVSEEE